MLRARTGYQLHGSVPSGMDAYRFCRFRRQAVVLSMMLVGLACFALYSLSFTCCTVINLGLDRTLKSGSRIIIFESRADEGHSSSDNRQKRDVVESPNFRAPQDDANSVKGDGHMSYKGDKFKTSFDSINRRFLNSASSSTEYDKNVDEDIPEAVLSTSRNEDNSLEYDLHADSDQLKNTYSHRKGYRTGLFSGILKTNQGGTKKLPQAIIIGVKKGGTRALLEFLRIHPDIRAAGPETHFFDRHYQKGLDWYRNQMPSTLEGQLTVEKTPSYFVTKGVPQKICNMSRKAKLIVVVRNPVTRAISDYTQASSKRPEMQSFEDMAFLDNSTGLVDSSWGAIRIGVYAKHLERWLQYFPLTQIHFVSGERLILDPAGEMEKVQDFLGIKRVITEKHFYFNTTKGFPCLKKTEGSGSPHCLGKTKGRRHPEVDGKLIERLRAFFRPFNQKFYQMTGIDFEWS